MPGRGQQGWFWREVSVSVRVPRKHIFWGVLVLSRISINSMFQMVVLIWGFVIFRRVRECLSLAGGSRAESFTTFGSWSDCPQPTFLGGYMQQTNLR